MNYVVLYYNIFGIKYEGFSDALLEFFLEFVKG